jgi:elongation factor Ts
MAQISASMVKQLRDKTGAGMMDCKKALNETGADLEAAVDWLRTKGLAAAANKAGRVAAEGLVGVAVSGTAGAAVEVNSETDFVARNTDFQGFVSATTAAALEVGGDMDKLGESDVAKSLTDLIGTIGENLVLRRSAGLAVGQGVVVSYMHNSIVPNLGKIGVLVALESEADQAALEALGKQLAMHVAAARPEALTRDDLDPAKVERERALLIEQAKESGQPEHVVEKMVEGRLRKNYYGEVVLEEQTFVIDGKTKVADAVAAAAKDAGSPIAIAGFVRFELGEGIEKRDDDFAAEVAAQAGV